jgi:hypothetical protein
MGRRRLGWVLTGIGALLVLLGVFELTSAGYGTRVRHNFAERRSYDMVKTDVHAALPWAATKALVGLGVVLLGARLRSRRLEQ